MKGILFLSIAALCCSATIKREDIPLDWRNKGVLGQVGLQGPCNTDWAFAASAAVSSCVSISAATQPLELSKQQLQDCLNTQTCVSGNVSTSDALDWITRNGLSLEAEYPYTQSDGKCHTTSKRWSMTSVVRGSSEEELFTMLPLGPVIVGYSGEALKSYTGGVITNASSSQIDSVGLLVGWTTNCQDNVTRCWIIRTSLGATWGEEGHFRVEIGQKLLGLGSSSFQPKGCYVLSRDGSYGPIETLDRPDGDLNANITWKADTAEQCQKLCYRNSECTAWAQDTCGNRCWLKKAVTTSTLSSCRSSGVITTPKSDYDGAYGRIENIDRPGADLGPSRTAGSADDCQSQCFKTPQCNAWAFDSCGDSCWLKGSSGDTQIRSCRSSGVITAARANRNGPYGPIEYVDRVGVDTASSKADSAEDCQLQCYKHPLCTVWAFDNCGNKCWLKRTSTGTQEASCRTSGIITVKKPNRSTNLGPIEYVDRLGGDLPGRWTAPTPEDCQAQCNNHPQCTVWSYDSCGDQCWLKSSTSGNQENGCRQSGTIPGKRGSRSNSLGPIVYNEDRVGPDVAERNANTPEDCQKQCKDLAQCRAWAFDTCGNRCWLKSSTSGTVAQSCRASGTVSKDDIGGNFQRGLTLVNNCDHPIRMCGMYAAYVFDMPPKSKRFVGDSGNPAYNQCNSVQVEVKFNQWNNFDWYDFSEVAIKWSGDPVKLIPPFGERTLYCNRRDCPDAYQYEHDDTKTHAIKTGGAFVAWWC